MVQATTVKTKSLSCGECVIAKHRSWCVVWYTRCLAREIGPLDSRRLLATTKCWNTITPSMSIQKGKVKVVQATTVKTNIFISRMGYRLNMDHGVLFGTLGAWQGNLDL